MKRRSFRFPSNVSKDDVKNWFNNLANSMGYGNEISYEDYEKFMGYDNLKVAVQQDRALLKAVEKCNIVEYEEEVDK